VEKTPKTFLDEKEADADQTRPTAVAIDRQNHSLTSKVEAQTTIKVVEMPESKKSAASSAEKSASSAEKSASSAEKSNKTDKTKEEILAEREAKKAEKAARRAAAKGTKKEVDPSGSTSSKEQKNDQPGQSKGDKAKNASNKPPRDENQAKVPPASSDQGEGAKKSNAELKAERRAKQEAQRAAKAAAAAEKQKQMAKAQPRRVPDEVQADRPSVEKKLQRRLASEGLPARTQAQRKVMLFSHLHQYEREMSIGRRLPAVGGAVHPAVLELGLKLADGVVVGANARCLALLAALRKVIEDYETPPQKELSRDLDARLKPYITFLRQCRPLSVSMGNAIRFLKAK
jgi:hypothetical protein